MGIIKHLCDQELQTPHICKCTLTPNMHRKKPKLCGSFNMSDYANMGTHFPLCLIYNGICDALSEFSLFKIELTWSFVVIIDHHRICWRKANVKRDRDDMMNYVLTGWIGNDWEENRKLTINAFVSIPVRLIKKTILLGGDFKKHWHRCKAGIVSILCGMSETACFWSMV